MSKLNRLLPVDPLTFLVHLDDFLQLCCWGQEGPSLERKEHVFFFFKSTGFMHCWHVVPHDLDAFSITPVSSTVGPLFVLG